MLHIAVHLVLPVLVAAVFYRPGWRLAGFVLVATMLVDLDHLVARPVYDPNRCSIDSHPLHTVPAIVLYALLAVVPLFLVARGREASSSRPLFILHLTGLGLVIHMALDWADCLLLSARS